MFFIYMHSQLRSLMATFLLSLALFASPLVIAQENHSNKGHTGHDHNEPGKHHDSEEHADSTRISNEQIALNNIQTETVMPRVINEVRTLFGVVSIPQDKIFRVFSTYESLIKQVHVSEGQVVKKGQLLLTLFNKQNLQTYTINSPSNGEISKRFANTGDHADENVLLEIIDLSHVWVELSAFPKDIDTLSLNQPALVYDLHQHKKIQGKIIYVAPIMNSGHIARARVLLENKNNHWRPGMHVKAEVVVSKTNATPAVKTSALQTLEGNQVVFTQRDNVFESTPVITGKSDEQYTQIINGLKTGDQYVSINSFLIKADIQKDGASHQH